ncbi:MAG TPA: ATP synthase F0 subunit B [Bryobacteraceae bacterium]
MRRAAQLLTLALVLLVPAVFAQENASDESRLDPWKWANFVVLAAGLGYLIAKNAGPFFDARTKKIREDMAQAEEMWKAAEARAAEVDRKLAGLESEIAKFRAESQQEAQNETERIKVQTAAEMARIRQQSEQEIAAAGKAARLELKRYSATLAVNLAEQKVRDRITPDAQDSLVREFVHDLEPPSADSAR